MSEQNNIFRIYYTMTAEINSVFALEDRGTASRPCVNASKYNKIRYVARLQEYLNINIRILNI